MRDKRGRLYAVMLLVLLSVMSALSTVSFAEEGGEACVHETTYTEWSGCDWYEYCSSCGELIKTGKTHSYEYTPWTYRSVNSHMRRGTCTVCGATTTASGNHTRKTCYEQHDEQQHERFLYCTTCYSTIGSVSLEDHELTHGTWSYLSTEQHERTVVCLQCGYQGIEYAGHVFSSGIWTPVSDTEHICERTCECGWSVSETSEHRDDDEDFYCDDCGMRLIRLFSVSVPSSLFLAVSETGTVTAATGAAIVNGSEGAVTVTDISVSGENGWSIVPYFSSMASVKVDSRLIGFMINGSYTSGAPGSGAETLDLRNGNWDIARGASLPLNYDAVISPVSSAVTNEKVLTVRFVVGWADQ